MRALLRLFRFVCWLWLFLLTAVAISEFVSQEANSQFSRSLMIGLVVLGLPAFVALYFSRSSKRRTAPEENVRLLRHDRGYTTEVVGVSFRQDNLRKAAGSKRARGAKLKRYAVLTCEDENQKDPNAVAVLIDSLRVGYLARECVEDYRRELADLDTSLPDAKVMALVSGGWRDEISEGIFSAKLSLKRPLEWAKIISKA